MQDQWLSTMTENVWEIDILCVYCSKHHPSNAVSIYWEGKLFRSVPSHPLLTELDPLLCLPQYQLSCTVRPGYTLPVILTACVNDNCDDGAKHDDDDDDVHDDDDNNNNNNNKLWHLQTRKTLYRHF